MKTTDTLVDDIHNMVLGKVAPTSDKHKITVSYDKWHKPRDKAREKNVLYFSEVGDPCPRKLWFRYNKPEISEDVGAPQLIKFFYGDMLEELVLNMAEDAGHVVESKQERVTYDVGNGWTIRGRIDAVIDGDVVDVKSVTKYSEEKFKYGLSDDPFGYKGQLMGYAAAMGKDRMGFLTIQKELGHVNYYPFPVDKHWFQHQAVAATEIVTSNTYEELPQFEAVPQSKTSKNKKLPTACGYCSYKKECWKNANGGQGLRAFLYSGGPEFLTEVVDTPRVVEILREDNSAC
jgi:hypothetical protein